MNAIPKSIELGNRFRGPFLPHHERRKRDETIVALAKAGMKSGCIGEIVGLSRTRTRAIMALYGVSRPVGRPKAQG